MRFNHLALAAGAAIAVGSAAPIVQAFPIFTVPVGNSSFEANDESNSPYASPALDVWTKAPVPQYLIDQVQAYLEGLGDPNAAIEAPAIAAGQFDQAVGTFNAVGSITPGHNGNGSPTTGFQGLNGAYMFPTPGNGISQDTGIGAINANYQVGALYQLTVAVNGGGNMDLNVPLDISLYYLDNSNVPTVIPGAMVEALNQNAPGNAISFLTDYSVNLPEVQSTDAWANRPIGVQIYSPYALAVNGVGYWDIDNVRLAAVPEPTTVLLLSMVAAGAGLRRRRRA